MGEVDDLVVRLVDEVFPWEEPGVPTRAGTWDERLRQVEGWLDRQVVEHRYASLALVAHVRRILDELTSRATARDGERLLARVDVTALVKAPGSILEKMARAWQEQPGAEPPFHFRNFHESLTDVGRFRVAANFLSDVHMIVETLQQPYRGVAPGALSAAQKALLNDYSLRGGAFEDSIHRVPSKRTGGERCCKGVFSPLDRPQLAIEVQVQTLLQEAWDKKDHFLIYERKRLGEEVPGRHLNEIFAMSELLFIADLTFDRLREDILRHRREGDQP